MMISLEFKHIFPNEATSWQRNDNQLIASVPRFELEVAGQWPFGRTRRVYRM